MGLAKNRYKIRRPSVTRATLAATMDRISRAMDDAMKVKGPGAFISVGEIRGYLDEEVGELHDEQHANDALRFADELVDVAITAIFGLASMETWK